MGGSKKETTTQDNSIDPWSRAQYDTVAGDVRGMLAQPYEGYGDNRVAGLSTDEQAARDMFTNNMGQGQGLLTQAAEAAQAAGGYRPENVTAQQFTGQDMSGYMNPNLDNVVDTTLAGIDRNRQLAENNVNDQFAASKAFGGDRQAVAQSENTRNYADLSAKTEASLRSDAYNNAVGIWQNDANRQLGADTTNAQLGLSGAQLGLQGAGLLSDIGQGISGMNAQDAFGLAQFGANERGIEQAGLDASYQNYLHQYDDNYRRMQANLGLLGATPMITDSSGTSVQRQSPGLGQLLGTGAQVASMFMSDIRLKRDIKPVGTHKGRKWYTFKYIADPLNRVFTGLMAQDLLKTEPDRVHMTESGYYAVDYAGVL